MQRLRLHAREQSLPKTAVGVRVGPPSGVQVIVLERAQLARSVFVLEYPSRPRLCACCDDRLNSPVLP